MTTLYIFGDESGTMPTKDSDKPFVTATVAFFEKTPHAIPGSDEDEKLVKILRESNAIPFLAIVKPFPGYGNSLKSKYDKMLVMARAKRLLNGSEVPDLDKDGINLRNEVWDHAMVQSILHAIRCAMYGGSIDSVRILLDERTMTKLRRELFTQMIYQLGSNIREYLERLKKARFRRDDQEIISKHVGRIKFSALSTTLHWSDDSARFRSQFALKLADRLARKMYRQLLNTSLIGIEHSLRNAGFEDFLHDITHLVTSPLSQKAIGAWKRDTGLPEPTM